MYDPEFIAWVERRTGLEVGWQTEASIERLYRIWLETR
jgi:hypothetical protein